MPLQLSPEQVRRLVQRMERERERESGDKSGDGREADAYDAAGLDTLATTLTPAQRHKHTAYLLFLEGADAEPGMSWGAWTLDALVQACQPEPTMTHAELFVPPENADQEVHFSTYLGKQANWGSAFAGGQSFYLGTNKDLWVAVPVMCMDAAHPYAEHWWPDGHIIGYEHTFVHTFADFVRAFADGSSFAPDFDDGVRVQEVLDAVLESSNNGSWTSSFSRSNLGSVRTKPGPRLWSSRASSRLERTNAARPSAFMWKVPARSSRFPSRYGLA